MNSLGGAAMFVAPLLALVRSGRSRCRCSRSIRASFRPSARLVRLRWNSIRDGTLIAAYRCEPAARRTRHPDRGRHRRSAGNCDGRQSRRLPTFLTPLFRFFSVLAGIAWIPIATLWFGYGFGAIMFVIFNAVFFVVAYNTLLGVKTIPLTLRNAAASLGAGRWAAADRGPAAGRACPTSSPASAPGSASPGAA